MSLLVQRTLTVRDVSSWHVNSFAVPLPSTRAATRSEVTMEEQEVKARYLECMKLGLGPE